MIAGAALLCLFVAGTADASIQGRHVAARIGHAVSQSRCLPAPAHADPSSSDMPLVAVLMGIRPYGSHVLLPLRVVRALSATDDPDAGDAPAASSGDARSVAMLPSHWGATHLSV